ncbi:MAG: hypothetical protein HOA90_03360, partial [Prolixibacteraceae bacterium]|nr:hypothetical protein [Prolixibacteraceae bacterium]
MKFKVKLSILSVFVFVVSACTFSEQKERGEKEDVFICDVEVIDAEKWRFTEALKKDIYFQNVESQSEDFAYSGKFSSKLFPGNPFGLTTDITNVKPDDYIQITAWRKSENQNGVIAIDGGEGFYNAGKYVIEKSENGWEKIFLEYFVPPNFYSGKVKVYLWNNSSDTVYFDDFQIVHRNNKKYPDYADVKGLQMHMDQLDLNRLGKKRLSAFETTVLVNSDEDYSSLVLFDGVDFLNGDFRLKGDLVDHLQGQKWSFRVKLKKEFAWKNMRTFSIQNPLTRSFLNEWLAHKIFEQEDILTTRYGFVTVKINKQSLGIYAWEEHFEKHLVESKNRREGPIVRFDETLFWQRVLETNSTKQNWDIDFFGASKILPFKVTRTVADTSLSAQFNEAQKLVFQYKNREKPVSEIFDIDKLAAYYALIDLTQAYHGFTWHNQRFYYNPVTCLLEPIAFDGYIESGIYKRIDEQVTGLLNPDKIKTFNKEELMLYQVFADSVFNKKYVQFLKEYSDSQFIENLISRYKPEADSLSELIKREFPYYEFNFNILKWQADYIRKNYIQIETNIEKLGVVVSAVNNEKFRKNYTSDINKNLIPFQVQAFYNKNKKQVEVLNYTNSPIKILGAFMSERLPESFDPRLELEAYNGIAASRISIPIE